jgi:putative tryptophan/tyrosine transport system substrate-binding protein
MVPPVLGADMKRREFITLLGGAVAMPSLVWPLGARAQQQPVPVMGFLASASADGYAYVLPWVREGLSLTGYVEGRNLAIEYRWADYQFDRLPALAADLVRRPVAVIFATGGVLSAIAAKSATATIPIVFAQGSDPVRYGLVASLNRPGGNVTGMTFYNSALGPKRIGLLREVVPKATLIAVLVNPNNPTAIPDTTEMQDAGRSIGVTIEVVHAGSESELDDAFAKAVQLRADALIVHIDALFQARDKQVVALAAKYAMPTMYSTRQFTPLGGLISYGTEPADVYRQAGAYAGRILRGEKPADLPVLQPTKFELVVNLRTAKALGLKIPESFLLLADEVIE